MTSRYIQKTLPKKDPTFGDMKLKEKKEKTEKLEIQVSGKLKSLFEMLLSEEGKEKIEVTSIILNVSLVNQAPVTLGRPNQTLAASTYKIICEEK
jgi:hypothetical protein